MADVVSDHIGLKSVPPARDQHLRDMANYIRFLSMVDRTSGRDGRVVDWRILLWPRPHRVGSY